MEKNQNQDTKKITEQLDLNNIKEEIDLIKSIPSTEINSVLSIKDLINSLKAKINIYEKQIKKLIDDKVKLQMEINEMILQNLQSKKKNSNNNNIENIDLNLFNMNNNIEKEENKIITSSLIDINQKLIEHNKELKEEIEIYKNNLNIYKQKIEDFKKNNNNKIKCQFCEEKQLVINKMTEEKKEIIVSITSLKKQLDELKLSEKYKKEKKKKREKINKTESLPNIEQYFILNNKFQLVDSDKNLWHMKKCLKFQEFKKKYDKTNLTSDDILKEFVDLYDSKIDEERSEENEYLEALNMSSNESEDIEHKKNENKYMPPLPCMPNNSKKKSGNKNITDIDNGYNNNQQIINNSDIQINIDENEENKKNYIKNDKNDKSDKNKNKNDEKKSESNDININENGSCSGNLNNLNEIKEETSFNLSDNTD